MIFETVFFFHELPRWNLGWPTPNYAGALLATLVPWAWAVRSRWGWRVAALGCEAGLFFLLAKTYSRGALMALVVAAGFYVTAAGWHRWHEERRMWAVRVALLGLCLVWTGFASRLTPAGAAADGAVLNRLELWKGGLAMVAAAPLQGWGTGESGRAFMNWFQDVDRTEGYATMVNSYLHVGVEHGMPVLGVVLLGLAWLLMTAWLRSREWEKSHSATTPTGSWPSGPDILAAAGASLLAWAVANIFTTLWIEPRLWVVPMLGGGLIVWAAWRSGSPAPASLSPSLRRITMAAAALAFLLSGSLWGAGVWLARSTPFAIAPGGVRTVHIEQRGKAASPGAPVWHVWPDTAVLGTAPGRELRRWFAQPGAPTRIVVHDPLGKGNGPVLAATDVILLLGKQVTRLGGGIFWRHERIVLLHPVGEPPDVDASLGLRRSQVSILLPEIDMMGNQPGWRDWAFTVGGQIVVSKGVGTDVRAAWPAVMARLTVKESKEIAQR